MTDTQCVALFLASLAATAPFYALVLAYYGTLKR